MRRAWRVAASCLPPEPTRCSRSTFYKAVVQRLNCPTREVSNAKAADVRLLQLLPADRFLAEVSDRGDL
jgi:hypothetical protein